MDIEVEGISKISANQQIKSHLVSVSLPHHWDPSNSNRIRADALRLNNTKGQDSTEYRQISCHILRGLRYIVR